MKMIKILMSLFLSLGTLKAEPVEPVVILGGGVGSLTSSLYLGRAGISPLVIEGPTPGGLLTQSHAVQNWPGVLEIEGAQLTEKMREQAVANGARFLSEEVIAVDFSKSPFTITTRALNGSNDTHKILAQSCIIAMGTKSNYLGVPGEQTYWGKGVSNCAVCDGALYKDQVIGIVGGGDAAVLEASYLANIAKEVHVFVRKDRLKAIEEKRLDTLLENPKVKFHYNTSVQEIKGDGIGVTGVTLKQGQKETPFKLDALFLAIGSTPNTAVFTNALKLDQRGYIVLEKDQETSVAGVYAIGDIVDPVYKQAVSAAGDGAKAAMQASQYIADKGTDRMIAKSAPKRAEKAAQKEMIEIKSAEQFKKELGLSDVPVVVDFYATWCGPCKQVAPALETSANKLAGKVKFLKVNVDKLSDLSSSYNIRAMPTVLLFDAKGKEQARKVGPAQIQDLLHELQEKN
jgi:thioredoxin reductase (NADPH)